MIYLILFPSDIENALIYRENPNVEILNYFRKKYPDIEWVFEYLYQRDFKKFDIEKLINLNAKKNYITSILNILLEDLSKKNLKDSILKIYQKYKNYYDQKSYEITFSILKDTSILFELSKKFPKSKILLNFLNKINFSSSLKAQILYYNKKYKEVVETIEPESALYFYVDALSKLNQFKKQVKYVKNIKLLILKRQITFLNAH